MKKASTIFLQIVLILIGIGALALLLWEPHLEGRNVNATLFEIYFMDPFLILAYAGSIPFFVAVYNAFKILGYVRKNMVFSPQVQKAIRTIKYCAYTIIGFVVIEEIIIILNHGNDDAAGGIVIGLLIILGSTVVANVAAVFEGILKSKYD
jgi:hypothetical protein